MASPSGVATSPTFDERGGAVKAISRTGDGHLDPGSLVRDFVFIGILDDEKADSALGVDAWLASDVGGDGPLEHGGDDHLVAFGGEVVQLPEDRYAHVAEATHRARDATPHVGERITEAGQPSRDGGRASEGLGLSRRDGGSAIDRTPVDDSYVRTGLAAPDEYEDAAEQELRRSRAGVRHGTSVTHVKGP